MRRFPPLSVVAVVLATGLVIAAPFSDRGTDWAQMVVADVGPVVLGFFATLTALRLSWRPAMDAPRRGAWRRLAIAFGCWWAGDLIWFVYEIMLRQAPFPSPADVGYLAFYPCAAWALLSFPSGARRRSDWLRLGLDALTVLLCAAMGIWYLVIGPTVHEQPGEGLAMVLNVAYPVGDMLLLFGVVVALMRRTAASDVSLRILVGGVGSLVIADVAFARLSLAGEYGGGLPDAFWAAAWCLFFLAGKAAARTVEAAPVSDEPQLRSVDLVGRYGGDELVIVLADCDGEAALAVAERIHSVVAATPVVTEDGVVNVTLSIGVAGSENGEGLVPVLARADLALYDAKRAGRACVREFAGAR